MMDETLPAAPGAASPSTSDVSKSIISRNQLRKSHKRDRPGEWNADTRCPETLFNKAWESFYRGKVVPEVEWSSFLAAMRTPLPMCLRMTLGAGYMSSTGENAVTHWLMEQLSQVTEVKDVSFTRGSTFAFQCDMSRGFLKRSDDLKNIKRVVAGLNEGGYLSRQEAVSMLPPLLLQVQPGHRVLDMCAAPGSKTAQILERLVGDGIFTSNRDNHGVVVANDVNVSRIDVLHHQTNRMAGAHPHLIVTNYDASRFPLLPPADRFHRVLCDVMCSGDGTLRKSVDLWPRWTTLQGADLHIMQCRVLRRGMSLCKEDGIVVYSTCSINPVEDEAVVSAAMAAIEKEGGLFEIVDPEPVLPGLQRSCGLYEWELMNRDCSSSFRSYEEAKSFMDTQKENAGKERKKPFVYTPSMFANKEQLMAQKMERACRILPHQQDTGGFFVVALHCMREVPWNEAKNGTPEAVLAALGACPLEAPSPNLREAVEKALQLPSDFPYDALVVRNATKREQKVYMAHPETIALSQKLGAKVVGMGGKVFEAVFKYSLDKFRFSPEGVEILKGCLPSGFFVKVEPHVIQKIIEKKGGVTFSSFCTEAGLQPVVFHRLPPSFLLECRLPDLGPCSLFSSCQKLHEKGSTESKELASTAVLRRLILPAEKMMNTQQISVKVLDWQSTLCELALGKLEVLSREKPENIETEN